MTPRQLERLVPLATPPLVPEIQVASLQVDANFEAFRTDAAQILARSTPYWAVSWPGGQALARYLLDMPDAVRGRDVFDLGCGNGLVSVAAAMGGARSVTAVDLDPDALTATALAAERTGLCIKTRQSNLAEIDPDAGAFICAADMWYDAAVAQQTTGLLRGLAASCDILISDADRSYRPRQNVRSLRNYSVSVSLEFESHTPMNVTIASFKADPMRQTHPPHACQG